MRLFSIAQFDTDIIEKIYGIETDAVDGQIIDARFIDDDQKNAAVSERIGCFQNASAVGRRLHEKISEKIV